MVAKEIKVRDDKYDLCVNPAVECLGVMLVLNNFVLNKERSNRLYREKIYKYFEDQKNHRALKLLNRLLQNPYFRYNGPVEMFLKIFYNESLDHEFCQKFGLEKDDIDAFLLNLQDFMDQSNFDAFFESNHDEYVLQMERFIKNLSVFSPVDYLLHFLKMKAKKLNVLLMFGVSTSNYGIEVAGKPYCCVRPYKKGRKGQIDFSFDMPYITTLLLHEFAHTIINPLTAKYRTKIEKINKEKFALCFERNSYGDDIETVVNEHVIRAIECMYVKANFESTYTSFIANYIDDGFLYLPNIIDLYKQYENGKYSDFAHFYDKIIEFFIRL